MIKTNENIIGGGRISWVDKMRGLAILSVVLQHVSYYFDSPEQITFLNLIALCNMGVFFFVSGYIMEETCKVSSLKTALFYIRKKFLQLMVPFLFWGLLSKYIFSREFLPITLADIEQQWRIPSLWYLLTLFGYVIPFALYRSWSRRNNKWWLNVLFWVTCILLLMFVFKTTGEFKFAAVYLPYFAIGVLVSEIRSLEEMFYSRWIGALCVVLILLFTNYYISGMQTLVNSLIKMVVTVSMIIVLYQICQLDWNSKVDSFISKCGCYSIGIYALHWPFINISCITDSISTTNELIIIAIALPISVIIATLCIFLKNCLSKYPIIDGLMFGGKWK